MQTDTPGTPAVSPIPAGFHAITPYIVAHNADQLIEFLKAAFGAREGHCLRGEHGRIAHAELSVGDSKIMVADPGDKCPALSAAFYLYVPDTDAVYRSALAAGGESLMEPADQFYGDRNAGVKDPAGNQWWIATRVEDVAPEELERRMREVKR